ncbi:hypothetical protein LTR50_004333 [Elasticomyces elasticus]|nr:hypothetical protein LTR50_004333 [Elasticomyces elasticus]
MDPQSVAFAPQADPWRLHNDIVRVQQVQADHADRLCKLERRQEDDAKMKSVWGTSSPFPGVLSGTPQQRPLQQLPADQFNTFDDDPGHLISSLHLDADEGPRRIGATSRANSVRFDESANQGHWAHASKSSVDLIPRTSSSLGGTPMNERTSSHKSEGRASSVHSVRSAASGRANSLSLDIGYSIGNPSSSPADTPGIAPGLFILGSVPAIIRCWMNTNFKHDALLYAAVCTGSYKSFLVYSLVEKLGFADRVTTGSSESRRLTLPVYFPEAVPHPASSRSSSPAPQLPALTVEFQVLDSASSDPQSTSIQIFLGSDVLRMHSADILFSSNSMTLYDDERSKLVIPLVRPENEATFKDLRITSTSDVSAPRSAILEVPKKEPALLNGLGQGIQGSAVSTTSPVPSTSDQPSPSGIYRPPGALAAESETVRASTPDIERPTPNTIPSQTNSSRPTLPFLNTKGEDKDKESAEPSPSQPTPLRSGSSPAIWGNWRREGTQSSSSEWGNGTKNDSSYQRKETGIKVLRPSRTAARNFSTTATSAASPVTSQSRFFDDGRRRSVADANDQAKRSTSLGTKDMVPTEATAGAASVTGGKPRSTNPVGGASAFAWLNSSLGS